MRQFSDCCGEELVQKYLEQAGEVLTSGDMVWRPVCPKCDEPCESVSLLSYYDQQAHFDLADLLDEKQREINAATNSSTVRFVALMNIRNAIDLGASLADIRQIAVVGLGEK